MISDITVKAKIRTQTGSADSRRLRKAGMIPVTVYGDRKAPLSMVVEAKQITMILRSESGHNTIFKLQAPDQEDTNVMIKEWQLDPVTGKLVHADFFRISLTEKQRVSVPLEFAGEARGVKIDKGILEHSLREIEIECLPTEIPEHITVDISGLGLGEHIYAKDIEVAANIRVVTPPEQAVVAVLAPRVQEETIATEVAEPEVIKKGKQEE